MKGILGRKVGMTQIFTEQGSLIPVTVIDVQPNKVLQVKSVEKDGYQALQLGVQDKRENLVNKPATGHFKKASSNPKRYVKEIRGMEGFEQGAEVNAADLFTNGEFVDVTGISKGKGFAGSIKRHNYHTGPMAHGSGYHRGVGSMGAIINRIFKSKKMPGHMGAEKVTIQNLEMVQIDQANHLVYIKGSVPGPRNSFVQIRQNVKHKANNQAASILVRKAEPAPLVQPSVEPAADTEA